jgi:DNA invertase Pin-like site-specific DNA recombinase
VASCHHLPLRGKNFRLAKQERVRLSERTKAGLRLAVSKGKTLVRPHAEFDTAKARTMRATGASYRVIAHELGASVATAHAALRSENVRASVAACA